MDRLLCPLLHISDPTVGFKCSLALRRGANGRSYGSDRISSALWQIEKDGFLVGTLGHICCGSVFISLLAVMALVKRCEFVGRG